jgi:DNA-directed RNA polymerase specialized sigma subunit
MDNHYHLLLQTKQENLSLMMRQVNSHYAIYFNKKEKRIGHLWQGRFRSWYVVNEEYLYLLLRYIEHNPIKANLANKIGEYPYTLAYTIFTNDETMLCTKASMMIENFSIQELAEFLEAETSEEEWDVLEQEQRRKVSVEDEQIKVACSKTLHEHFQDAISKQERNCAITKAFKDGHTQSSIAKHLQLSPSMICGVIKNGSED